MLHVLGSEDRHDTFACAIVRKLVLGPAGTMARLVVPGICITKGGKVLLGILFEPQVMTSKGAQKQTSKGAQKQSMFLGHPPQFNGFDSQLAGSSPMRMACP